MQCNVLGMHVPFSPLGPEHHRNSLRSIVLTGAFVTGTNGGTVISDPSSLIAQLRPQCPAETGFISKRMAQPLVLPMPNVSGAYPTVSKIVHPDGLIERVMHATSIRNIGTYHLLPTAPLPQFPIKRVILFFL